MQVTLDLPDQYFLDADAGEIEKRLKLYMALFRFQEGKLSAGAACELADVDRYTFLAACKRHGIPAMRYDAGELEDDLEQLRGAR